MPNCQDFQISRFEDGTATVVINPPVSISGWAIRFNLMKRFGSDTPLSTKYLASGFNGVSGITIQDGANGKFLVDITSQDTSGEFGNYAYQSVRMDSGFRTVLTEGYMLIGP